MIAVKDRSGRSGGTGGLAGFVDEQPDQVEAAEADRDQSHRDGAVCLGDQERHQMRAGQQCGPMPAAASRLTPGERVSRRASCGDTSAMKPMGPAAAVTRAEIATPTTSSASLSRPTRVPRVIAESSPDSSLLRLGDSARAAATMTPPTSNEGSMLIHVTREREPAPQNPTVIASSISALVIR